LRSGADREELSPPSEESKKPEKGKTNGRWTSKEHERFEEGKKVGNFSTGAIWKGVEGGRKAHWDKIWSLDPLPRLEVLPEGGRHRGLYSEEARGTAESAEELGSRRNHSVE